jgi:hypothetical protein
LNNNIHSSDLINEINFKVPQRITCLQTSFKPKKPKTNLNKYFALSRCQNLWNLAGDVGFDVFSDGMNKILTLFDSDDFPFILE